MADLSDIATSREFRNSDHEVQRETLIKADPSGFGALGPDEQDGLLRRVKDELAPGWYENEWTDEFKRGAARASAGFVHMAKNAVDLTSMDVAYEAAGIDPMRASEKWLAEKEAELNKIGERPDDRTNMEVAAGILGEASVAAPVIIGAIGAAAVGLPAMGISAAYAAPIVLGAMGAIGEADKGFVDSMLAGTIDAAFGALFPAMAGKSRAARAAVFGAITYQMTPEEMEIEERLGHGALMSAFGAWNPAIMRGGNEVRPPMMRPERLQIPEVAGKAQAEARYNDLNRMRGDYEREIDHAVPEGETIVDLKPIEGRPGEVEPVTDRLEGPRTPEEIAKMEAKVRELPEEEQRMYERILQEQKREAAVEEVLAEEAPVVEGELLIPGKAEETLPTGVRWHRGELGEKPAEVARDAASDAGLTGAGEQRAVGLLDQVSSPRTEIGGQGDPSGGGARGGAIVPPVRRPTAEVPEAVEHVSNMGDRRRLEYFDDMHGFLWMARKAGLEDMPDSVYKASRNLRGIAELQDQMVMDTGYGQGHPVVKTDPLRPGDTIIGVEGEGMGTILAPVLVNKKKSDAYGEYSHALQSEELINQFMEKDGSIRQATPEEIAQKLTREKHWDLERIAQGKALETPEFQEVFRKQVEYNKKVIDFVVDMGFLPRAQADSFQRKVYAYSFKRNEQAGQRGRAKTDDKLVGTFGIQKLYGKDVEINDWLHNSLTGPQDLVRAAIVNKFTREAIADAVDAGGFVTKIPAASKRIQISDAVLKNALKEEVQGLAGMTEAETASYMRWIGDMPGDITRIGFFLGGNKPYGNDIISFVNPNGKTEHYRAYDPVLWRSFSRLNRQTRKGVIGRWMGGLKTFKQHMITMDPSFIAGNFTRDPIMSSVTTRTGNQALTSAINGHYHQIKSSKELKDLISNGLGGATLRNSPKLTRKMLTKKARRMNRSFFNPANMIITPGDVWRFLNRTGRVIELAPRIGESLRGRRKGFYGPRRGEPASMIESVYGGRDISTDFAVKGGGESTGKPKPKYLPEGLHFTNGPQLAEFMRETVPFFSAAMAGSDKGYRATFRDPHGKANTAVKIGMVGMYSMVLAAINNDLAEEYPDLKDEDGRPQVDYKTLPLWARTAAWHYYVPEEWDVRTGRITKFKHWTQPKIWDVGMVGTWAERTYEWLIANGTEDDKSLALDMIQIAAQNFQINTSARGFPFPLPAGIDILAEQATNRIGFTGQPIETEGMREMSPWARSRAGTSTTMEKYGELVWDQDWMHPWIQSPARAEALLRGLFGNWASIGLHVTDEVFFPGGPALGWDDIPVMRRFYQEAGKYNKNTEVYYDNLQTYLQAQGTYRAMGKRGNQKMAEQIELAPDQKAMIAMAPGFDKANRKLQLLNRAINLTKRGVLDPELSPSERHHQINYLEAQRNTVMKKLNEKAEQYKREARE